MFDLSNRSTWDLFIYLIGALGFPICVTIWLLYERATIMRDLIVTMNSLQLATARLTTLIEDGVKLVPARYIRPGE